MKEILVLWYDYKRWVVKKNEEAIRELERNRAPIPTSPIYNKSFEGFMDYLENNFHL